MVKVITRIIIFHHAFALVELAGIKGNLALSDLAETRKIDGLPKLFIIEKAAIGDLYEYGSSHDGWGVIDILPIPTK